MENKIDNKKVIRMNPILWTWKCPLCNFDNDEEDHAGEYIECGKCKKRFSNFEVSH